MWAASIAVPVCGSSSVVVGLLGSRHVHTGDHSLLSTGGDAMAGWVDPRRSTASSDHALLHSHEGSDHSHTGAERHRHAGVDRTVIALDAGADSGSAHDGPVSASAPGLFPASWIPAVRSGPPATPVRWLKARPKPVDRWIATVAEHPPKA